MTLCLRCNELTVERLAARYPLGLPILSGALALAAVTIFAFWPLRSLTVQTLLWGGLLGIGLAFGGGLIAAFVALFFLKWFHQLRMWWEGWK